MRGESADVGGRPVIKHVLITGVTGQDGGYLSKLLVENGYRVYGLDRRTSTPTTERLHYLEVLDRITLLAGDVTDQGSMVRGRAQADDRMVPELGTAGRQVTPASAQYRGQSASRLL